MKKVLYAKLSRERRLPFQIATRILEEDGQRRVEKQALTPEAEDHIGRLAENGKKLEQLYRYPSLHVCPCRRMDQRRAAFPFLEGKSLESLLTEHVERGEFERVKEDVRLLWEILESASGLRPFRSTPEFEELFGTVALPEGLTAAPLSNLDMIFANLLVEETKDGTDYHLVDYEWVFDFMVPISFLFARSLILHGMLQTLPREQLEELYAIGGVKPEEIPVYYGMEVSFQRYVAGRDELYVLSKLYPRMRRCCFFLDYWNTEHVYYGVTLLGVPKERPEEPEELHFSLHFQGEVKETVAIPDTKRYREFILRPADTECILKLYGIRGGEADGAREAEEKSGAGAVYGEEAELLSHNAQVHYEDIYHFRENPEFRIKNKGYDCLSIGYIIYHRNDYLVKEGIELRLQNEHLQKRLNLFIWPYKAVRRAAGRLKEKASGKRKV